MLDFNILRALEGELARVRQHNQELAAEVERLRALAGNALKHDAVHQAMAASGYGGLSRDRITGIVSELEKLGWSFS